MLAEVSVDARERSIFGVALGSVAEMLADTPEIPEQRWLDELRRSGVELYDRIQHHIVDEEDQLFRVAGSHLTPDDQETLASAFKKIQSGKSQG